MHKYRSIGVCLSSALLFLTCLSVMALTLPSASADDSVVTEVQLSVPVSCSMSGTGMESHNTEVVNGRTQENIGLTTINAFCNDTSGFAIYAIGFTDYTYGNTVLTDDELGSSYDIATSSTVVDATSSWSMKLAATSGTYTPIIAGSSADTEKETGDPDFTSYQAVPTNYTRVAYRASSTDIGSSATGSTITTTYRAHISPTQAAGNYSGQVKYTLVHPHNRRAAGIPTNRQVQVTYDAGIGYFGNDSSNKTNVLTYDADCEMDNKGYYTSRTSNLDERGNKISSLTTEDSSSEGIQIPGASKLKIVLDYDFIFNEGNTLIEEDGNTYYENGAIYVCDLDSCSAYYGTGTQTIIINDDKVYIDSYIDSGVTIDSAHDYGYYARIYPLDENDEEYTFTEYHDCSWTRTSGEFIEIPNHDGYANFGGWGLNNSTLWDYTEDEIMTIILNGQSDEVELDARWFY